MGGDILEIVLSRNSSVCVYRCASKQWLTAVFVVRYSVSFRNLPLSVAHNFLKPSFWAEVSIRSTKILTES